MSLVGEVKKEIKDGLIIYTIGKQNILVFVSAKSVAKEDFMLNPTYHTYRPIVSFPQEFVEAIIE